MRYHAGMTITLPKDIEGWAREEVAAGRAESVEAFVGGALREFRSMAAGHKTLVEQAYQSLARGEVSEEADVDAELDRWIAEDVATQR